MVSVAELERVRELLRRPGKPTPQKHDFPLTGLIRCGECGFMVTAENKTNRHGHRYTYYHCSKRRLDYRCQQRSVRAEALDLMAKEELSAIALAAPLHEFFLRDRKGAEEETKKLKEAERHSVEKGLHETESWLANLRRLQVRGRISETEFDQEAQAIQQERRRLEESLACLDKATERFEFEGMLNSFRVQAFSRYERGNNQTKRMVLRAIGSNLTLRDKKLCIEAKTPFVKVTTEPSYCNGRERRDAVGNEFPLILEKIIEKSDTLTEKIVLMQKLMLIKKV